MIVEPTRNQKILTAIIVLTFILFYQYVVISPLTSDIDSLSKDLKNLNTSVEKLKVLKKKQIELSQLMVKARSQQVADNSSLASRIEELLDRLKLADNALSIKPLPVTQSVGDGIEENIEIRFHKLGFKDILVLLNEISSLPGSTRISELDIKKRNNVATMSLVVTSLLFNEGSNL